MRRFEFEADIYETLECVPMAVREKLDRAGIKISLEQWQSFALDERRRICDFSIEFAAQLKELADLLKKLVRDRGGEPDALSREQQRRAVPTDRVPERVAANARSLGFKLDDAAWCLLSVDERYALMKLGGKDRIKRNFEVALREFLSEEDRSEAR